MGRTPGDHSEAEVSPVSDLRTHRTEFRQPDPPSGPPAIGRSTKAQMPRATKNRSIQNHRSSGMEQGRRDEFRVQLSDTTFDEFQVLKSTNRLEHVEEGDPPKPLNSRMPIEGYVFHRRPEHGCVSLRRPLRSGSRTGPSKPRTNDTEENRVRPPSERRVQASHLGRRALEGAL